MTDYPVRQFSFGAIDRAGKLLATDIPLDRVNDEAVREAFKTAHNWRMAHAYPMVAERMRLNHIAKGGFVTAGRVKRMTSVRKKLKRGSATLRGMQDLAGCRAVMTSVADCYHVFEAYKNGASASEFHRSRDYMAEPKPDGYRGIHAILRFGGTGRSEPYIGQHLELQIRTRLQHIWATAIEAIGAVRGEDLKGGQGDASWLRLMALMGDYLAVCDGLPLPDGYQGTHGLCRQINEMDRSLNALVNLKMINEVIERASNAPSQSHVFRLSLDAVTGKLMVEVQRGFVLIGDEYMRQETEQQQSVVVNVNRVIDLKRAFPNYYLDLGAFIRHLAWAVQYRLVAPKMMVATPSLDNLDLSFLTKWKRTKKPA
ncbi:RelA/SpoT domain-containing protein [Paracoccus angustae]|uniref:RelA/SpoT domain-containing protein n=1 Tax=Paracoccus angustae TaxID=1671480 RepID=A0ABV7TZL4_9RHOB